MNNSFVYLLLSEKDHRTYIGSTDNIERRITEHNAGKTPSTKNRRPLRLIYQEEFNSLLEARIRERYLKSRKGRNELKEIFQKISTVAKRPVSPEASRGG